MLRPAHVRLPLSGLVAGIAIVSGLVLATGVADAQVPTAPPLGDQLVIAHRGASAYRPEHTFSAYDLAMAQDADMLECDLQLTKDEVLVCIHDTTVDRTSDGSGAVHDLTLAELRALDWGAWFSQEHAGQQVVPFEEQLDCYLAHNSRSRFHVETKGPATYGGLMEERLVELLIRKGLVDTGDVDTSTVLVQSFDAPSLELIKQLAPSLPTAYLFLGPEATAAAPGVAAGVLPDYVDAAAPNSVGLLAAGAAWVQAFHANGHPVHTWTVNDRAQMDLLLAWGVDGIFTDTPDVLREAVDAAGNSTTARDRNNPSAFAEGCPGIAGRVTSKDGPGDVFVPAEGGRGVTLVQQTVPATGRSSTSAAPPAAAEPTASSPAVAAAPSPLPTTGSGAAALGALALGGAALLARRNR